MARKTKEELQVIIDELNVSKLWSFSRVNQWLTDKYTYYLKYVMKITPDRDDGIYGVSGGKCHDIMEEFYTNDSDINTHEDMLEEYEDAILEFDMMGLRYNKTDEEANLKTANKYEACMRHFFMNHTPLTDNLNLEDFITIKVRGQQFQGYVDFWHMEEIDEEEFLVITDWKTSTKYSGAKIKKEGRQLLLYALGMHQIKSIPLDKIKIRWNFMKYLTVSYEQANGKLKDMHKERHNWVDKSKVQIKMWLKKLGYEDEIDYYMDMAIEENSIKSLPQEVQDKFSIGDCYIYIDFDENDINNLTDELMCAIIDIEKTTLEFEKTEDDKLFYTEVNDSNSFYFNNLCDYSIKYHKPYKEYIDNLNMFNDEANNEEEESLDWMDDLLG